MIFAEVVMENWYQNYDELKDYIKGHPSIEISASVMVMPDDVRPEFYRLFNRVRAAFVKEKHPALLAEASQLSASFAAARTETMACLNLKEVVVNPYLADFLQDPADGLMRPLFDPLFALLKGKINIEAFEQTAPNLVETSARTLLHQGYIHWTTLSLMKLMAPDTAHLVAVVDDTDEPDLTSAVTRPGWYTEEVPRLAVAERLPLDFSPYTHFLVPRVILHSGVLNAFAAISTDFHEVYRRAKDLSQHLKWYSIEEIRSEFGMGDLWPDMVLVLGDSGEDLSIAADYFNIARPDVLVDVMETGDWYQAGGMEKIKRHKNILKPRLGAFVVCRQPVPLAAIEELAPPPPPVQAATPAAEGAGQPLPVADTAPAASAGEPCQDIHLLSVGYDPGALEPIVEALRQWRTIGKEDQDVRLADKPAGWRTGIYS
jgi:hypothetical protein